MPAESELAGPASTPTLLVNGPQVHATRDVEWQGGRVDLHLGPGEMTCAPKRHRRDPGRVTPIEPCLPPRPYPCGAQRCMA
jgi:hypothetical protein